MTDQNVNRPFAAVSPALRTVGALSSTGYLEYNGLLMKFQRRSANHISFLNSYTFGRAIDLTSDNDGTVTLTNIFDPEYNRGPADYDVRHTFSSNWIYELPWAAQKAWGGWQVSGIIYAAQRPPDHDHAVAEHAVDRHHEQPAEHHLRSGAEQPDDRPVVQHRLLPAGRRHHRHVRQHGPQHRPRTGTVQHRCVDDQEHEDRSCRSELRLEIFNLLNHPQFANPNGQLGNSAFGTISAMLASPSCALCGTTERQMQVAVKLKF